MSLCPFSSTFDTENPFRCLLSTDLHSLLAAFVFRPPQSRSRRVFLLALAEELYLVFMACIERLLCRAAKYSPSELHAVGVLAS